MSTFLMGMNYWPAASAMYMWERFELAAFRDDMARIRALGMHAVRFFLGWEAFQPEARAMDRGALRTFEMMMDAMHDAGLRAMPTLFCGHMSGVNWLPSWTLDRATGHGRFRTISRGGEAPHGIGDFYADPDLLRAQVFFCERVGERMRGHPALYLWDLGNEFSNMREPERPEDAAEWSARLTDALTRTSGAGSTGGLHGEDVERDRKIRPSSIAAPWTLATMHGYSVYAAFSEGRLDTNAVPFYETLAASLSKKPVLFSEFGNPACAPGTTDAEQAKPFACLHEEEMAAYCTTVLDRLQRAGSLGAFWWCWSDYDEALATLPPFDLAPHELRFGAMRADGSEKPVAKALRRFAAEARTVQPQTPLDVDEQEYYAGLPGTGHALYRRYRS
jgi:endo-1,4-beta-mannosidase